MKMKYGTSISKGKPADRDMPLFIKVLLTDASKVFSRVDKITLPLTITISEDHNSMQWYAEMEE